MCNRESYSFNNDDADGSKFCASLLNFRTLISHFARSFTWNFVHDTLRILHAVNSSQILTHANKCIKLTEERH